MKLKKLTELIQSEDLCKEYLRKVGIIKTFNSCISCGAENPGIIRRDKYKCYNCRSEWSIYRNSFLATINIELSQFLLAVKLFQYEKSTYMCADELEITRKTAAKIYSHIRKSTTGIDSSSMDNAVIKNNTPLVRIALGKEGITVTIISVSAEPSESDEGSFIIGLRSTDAGKNVFYNFESIYKSNVKSIGKNLSTESKEINRFWSFAIERLHSFNGTTIGHFYEYLKEIEFRYNHRNDDLYEEIILKLSKN